MRERERKSESEETDAERQIDRQREREALTNRERAKEGMKRKVYGGKRKGRSK